MNTCEQQQDICCKCSSCPCTWNINAAKQHELFQKQSTYLQLL